MKNLKFIYVVLSVLMASLAVSCNKDKDDGSDVYVYTTSTGSTLVSKFVLQANSDVMENLDSVFFTIDPERGAIYNADSLPVGTDVSALKVTMTFNSSVGSAIFHIYDADKAVTDYEYSSTSSQAIDFRYGVILSVTSADGLKTKEYSVKVNVHKENPDSIAWPQSARRNLPGAADSNYAMGTACWSNTYWCLLHNSDGYVFSNAYTPEGPWTTVDVSWGFEPDASSLTATGEALYVLDVNGDLYEMKDDNGWKPTGVRWKSILGGYGDRLLGVTDEPYCYDEYPRRDSFTPTTVHESFPIVGSSQMVEAQATWSISNLAAIVGGTTASGETTNAVWGYDGDNWAMISAANSILPALYAPTLFVYLTFTTDETTLVTTEQETWVVMGGKYSDGAINKITYVSKDHGITWAKAGSALNQPSFMTPFYGAQAHVYVAKVSYAPAQAPLLKASQAQNEWDCPYIYIFGGYNSKGKLLNNIWKGVLLRHTHKPLI